MMHQRQAEHHIGPAPVIKSRSLSPRPTLPRREVRQVHHQRDDVIRAGGPGFAVEDFARILVAIYGNDRARALGGDTREDAGVCAQVPGQGRTTRCNMPQHKILFPLKVRRAVGMALGVLRPVRMQRPIGQSLDEPLQAVQQREQRYPGLPASARPRRLSGTLPSAQAALGPGWEPDMRRDAALEPPQSVEIPDRFLRRDPLQARAE